MLSGFLVKEDVYAGDTQQKSNAESQVTITFVESSENQEQVQIGRKDSQNMDLDRHSKILLPSTGSKLSWLVFVSGILAFFLSTIILSIRRENRRNNI
ncbi:LPXTG cell wall anchor domain-containing protein [Enterococcus faecalis]|nr:LPXTG cell wall anchor domain-containing protein [Enterococcus faecalis]MBW4175250.1 LPXTG cell wall anchor domain-containing protein [Enterococcus faecalis]MBW4177524.1 LPXTG cell wall anchor domain-containing protein [Enterococcus faecalis]MCD5000828.1 LPXTG cell wall anchor domain-containing protein [Enterococcus faecalis]MCD5269314.1 LPXTG cell wall anchor domain-containing protein [Enterococcus faecalis]